MKLYFMLLIMLTFLFQICLNINPYHVLELEQGATQSEIRKQFKLLKKSAKGNTAKIQSYNQAYQQIMIDSTLQMTLPKDARANKAKQQSRRNRRRRRGMPRLSDMFRRDYFAGANPANQQTTKQKQFYAQDTRNYRQQLQKQYGYRLPPQIDDPSLYRQRNNIQQAMKDQNRAFNVKAASTVLFIGGILLKLLPCFCIYLICRKWKPAGKNQNQQQINPFMKAANGWAGKNRRTLKKTK